MLKTFYSLLIFLSSVPFYGADNYRIAAIVNDDVISAKDVEDRINLFLTSLPPQTNKQEVKQHIRPQILRAIIDELLWLQAAKKHKIDIDQGDVESQLRELEKRQGIAENTVGAHFKKEGLSLASLKQQIEANIARILLIQNYYGASLKVPTKEIKDATKRAEESIGKPKYHLAEIFFAVDQLNMENKIKQDTFYIYEQLKKGANFMSVAQQFSQSPSAARGGDIGWVEPDDLDPAVAKTISNMGNNSMSAPIRSKRGYHILMLRDKKIQQPKKELSVNYVQVYMPYPMDTPKHRIEKAYAKLNDVRGSLKDCNSAKMLEAKVPGVQTENYNNILIDELPFSEKTLLNTLQVNESSPVLKESNKVSFYVMCSKKTVTNKVNTKEIAHELKIRKLEKLAQRVLRDLRKAAFVELRM